MWSIFIILSSQSHRQKSTRSEIQPPHLDGERDVQFASILPNLSLPHCLLFGNRFVFYICESVSVLHTESFVLFFRLHVVISYSICLFLSNLNFTEHNSLQVHPHCCKWQYFILFYGWVVFHYVYISLSTHLSIDI